MLLSGEQKCLLWLSAAEVTPGHVQKLTDDFGSAQGIWDAFENHGQKMFKPLVFEKLKSLYSHAAVDDLQAKLARKNVHLLFRSDENYPPLLASIQDPPYLLYYAGRLTCLERPTVAIVGTRHASRYGSEMAAAISRELCEAGVCVVSGLARGIDKAAHEAAVACGGYTTGVLGSGINVPYPPEHTRLLRSIAGGIGLVLSEYPLDASPAPYHFPHRNRIISGLCQGVVFVEGKIKSGGMHTVHSALMQGREVFAVPGQVGLAGSEGPHAILREGARIVTCAQDILDDLSIETTVHRKVGQPVKLLPLQQRIVNALNIERLYPQEIAQNLQCDVSEIIIELGTLEIMGIVQREAGNRFYLPVQATL